MKKSATIELNKWHFKLGIISTYWDNFGYMVHFGFFKPTSFPAGGAMITKENYRGFWFRKIIRIRGFELSFQFPNRKNIIDFLFWKYQAIPEGAPKLEEDAMRKPSKFHELLYKVFRRYFNPQ